MFVYTDGFCIEVHSEASYKVHLILDKNWINSHVMCSNIHTIYQSNIFKHFDIYVMSFLSISFNHVEK